MRQLGETVSFRVNSEVLKRATALLNRERQRLSINIRLAEFCRVAVLRGIEQMEKQEHPLDAPKKAPEETATEAAA